MFIGIHDADAEHLHNKSYPNYALMKISAWHKARGDTVEWWEPTVPYDKVYSSKIFGFTGENPSLPAGTVKGGTGYGAKGELPKEVDCMFPDYSIYPACDYAIGFTTRGCPNSCPWCCVPEKEGEVRPYRDWKELIRKDTDKLVLMDNNILSCEYGVSQLRKLSKSKIRIDLNQGMDIRLVTEETVQMFKDANWIKYIRFSCDTKGQLPYFERVLGWFAKYKVSRSRVFVYLLVRKDLGDAEHRARALHGMFKSINIYAQAERNEGLGLVPNKMQLEFANRYIYGRSYKKETWPDYCDRHKLK